MGGDRGRIPFSAFWLRSSVVSVLISLISDTRDTVPYDINLISLGSGSIRQLAARTRERRLGLALPPWLAQPSPLFPPGEVPNQDQTAKAGVQKEMHTGNESMAVFRECLYTRK